MGIPWCCTTHQPFNCKVIFIYCRNCAVYFLVTCTIYSPRGLCDCTDLLLLSHHSPSFNYIELISAHFTQFFSHFGTLFRYAYFQNLFQFLRENSRYSFNEESTRGSWEICISFSSIWSCLFQYPKFIDFYHKFDFQLLLFINFHILWWSLDDPNTHLCFSSCFSFSMSYLIALFFCSLDEKEQLISFFSTVSPISL